MYEDSVKFFSSASMPITDILTQPKNAIIKQYVQLFDEEGVKLQFTDAAMRAMAEQAKKAGTGARALRMIVENILLNLMFDVPSDPTISEIIVDKESVIDRAPPTVRYGVRELSG